MIKKIALLGNHRSPWCTEVHVALSLEELGIQVVRLQEDEVSNGEIIGVAENVDAFFFIHTWGWGQMDFATLNEVKRYCPTIYFHLDLIRGIKDREDTVDSSWWYKCDYVFMPDGDKTSVTWFRQKGINYHYSPPGVFHGGCYEAEPVEEWKQDVVFVGAYGYHEQWQYRPHLIDNLRNQYGSRFTLYEHSSQMREHRLNQLYASVKVAVGDTFCPGFSRSNYFSDRLVETSGRSASATQVFPYIKGIERLYEPDKEILTYQYGNWMDLYFKIDWLLDHPEEREQIRKAAFERTKREHTYVHRLKNVLDVIDGKKNIWETS